jgi:hypothetical protein
MRNKIIIIFSFFSSLSFSQGISFKVEELKKPDNLLYQTYYKDLLQNLMLSNVDIPKYYIDSNKIDVPIRIIANSNLPDSLVYFGNNSFFNGMYQAYAEHRPFVLSPDMIWLLISQGFARHVNANSEKLRKYFVNFNGKVSLVVQNSNINLDNPNSPWDSVFLEFTKQISDYTGTELIDVLTSNFSTTTSAEKVASEITIMEAMKSYFDYIVVRMVCGIPEITLKGTPKDWQNIYNKAQLLRKYQLDWWIDELEPILTELINTSKGEIDTDFWRNMFKYHSQRKYGAPKIIDGWIIKFFPYDFNGNRNNLEQLIGGDNLPPEIVKVDLKFIEVIDGQTKNKPLELWAGFLGLKQNNKTFALEPQIGWMIKEKDIDNKIISESLKYSNSSDFGIEINVDTIPNGLFELGHIRSLTINFIDGIKIPDEMAKVKIDRFEIYGRISKSEIERVCRLFPNTILKINNKQYNAR